MDIEILEKELAYDRLQAEITVRQIKYAKQQAKILEKEMFLLKAKNTGSSMIVKDEKKEDKRKTSEPTQGQTQVFAPQTQPKKAYAIFTGPNRGVYASYPHEASERDTVKEFASEFEARH